MISLKCCILVTLLFIALLFISVFEIVEVMYRAAMAEQKRASDEANALTKIGHWPVVSDSWDKLSTLYTRTKESNRLVNFTFGTAEAGLKAAVNLATPVATTVLGKPSEFTFKVVVKRCV
jgi:hypothetical protein